VCPDSAAIIVDVLLADEKKATAEQTTWAISAAFIHAV
jgi:hypothetical protein